MPDLRNFSPRRAIPRKSTRQTNIELAAPYAIAVQVLTAIVIGRALLALPMRVRFDFLDIILVQMRQFRSGGAVGPQQFIDLCMKGLGVAVLGPRYEERHEQRGDRCRTIPTERRGNAINHVKA